MMKAELRNPVWHDQFKTSVLSWPKKKEQEQTGNREGKKISVLSELSCSIPGATATPASSYFVLLLPLLFYQPSTLNHQPCINCANTKPSMSKATPRLVCSATR